MPAQHNSVSFGRYRLERAPLGLSRDGQPLDVPPAALQVLERLVASPGAVVHFAELQGSGSAASAAPGLRTTVRLLRDLLRDSVRYPMYIETVRGQGYRFLAPVVPVGDDSGSSANARFESPALGRWIADDEAAVSFAAVWTVVAIPATITLGSAVALPLVLIPPILRLGFRARAAEEIVRVVDHSDLVTALEEADSAQARTRTKPVGWRHLVQRAAHVLVIASLLTLLPLLLSKALRPWTWSAPLQSAYAGVVSSGFKLFLLAFVAVEIHAAVSPAPAFARLRQFAQRKWRGYIRSRILPTEPHIDTYTVDARREVESMLAAPTPRL